MLLVLNDYQIDPDTLITNERVLEPLVFKALGQLYQNVPKDHKYRFYRYSVIKFFSLLVLAVGFQNFLCYRIKKFKLIRDGGHRPLNPMPIF